MGHPAGLTEDEISLRKRWLEFGSQDEHLIAELDPILSEHLDAIIADMYDHFFAFDETRAFFPDDATLMRAKAAQRQYFARLTKGNYGVEYVRDRLRVGATHYKIDLDPKWYLGAYSHVLGAILPLLSAAFSTNPEKLTQAIAAVLKVIFLDMGLAIETYISAKEAAIRQHRDAIAELETERRVTKSIMEGAPIAIVRVNDAFACVECNDEFLKLLGSTDRREVVGKPLFELAPELPRELLGRVMESGHAYQGTAEALEFPLSPVVAYWDWAAWPVKGDHGDMLGLLAMFVNATDRVLLQQQREDFVATLTHDLKTPILAANRAVKLLVEGDFGQVSPEQSRILETIHQSNESLYKLVQTLLDVYRYDSGAKQLHLGKSNLALTIRRLAEELRPLATSKEVTLTADLPNEPVEVNCDEAEIRRVVQNLLDNSLKFTPAGGKITIALTREPGATTITVNDTGKGVSEEDMPKLFQRFWQAASSGRYYASTGLGLYLCRKIVELHDGKIFCESTLGKGSTFGFTIREPVHHSFG